MTLRRKKLRDNVGEMLQEVTSDVGIKPMLQSLTGDEQSIGGNISERRADISVRRFWCREKKAFSM